MTGKRPAGRVFITGGVQRKALAAALALKGAGLEVTVGDPSRLALTLWSLRVDHRVLYPDPEVDEEAFIQFLLRRFHRHPVDLLFPTGGEGEINAVHRHRKRLEEVVRVGLTPPELFDVTEDKGELLKRAALAGVSVPLTWYPESVEEALDRALEFAYPVLIKPRRGSGGRGIVHAADAAAFRAAYPAVAAQHLKPIVQEYVPSDGVGLGAAALYDLAAKPVVVFTYRRLREFPIGAGPSTFTESTDDPQVREEATRLLSSLAWQGLAMVEFRRDKRDGRPKLIEVNGRFWGSALLPIVSGVNFPWLYYQLMTTGKVTAPPPYRVGIRCRWLFPGDTLHFLTNPKRWQMDPPFFQFFARNTYYDPPMWPDPLPMIGQVFWAVRNLFDPGTVRKYLRRR
jgi:predicted ATP-grasp superfamily ATP-dependent carboligase